MVQHRDEQHAYRSVVTWRGSTAAGYEGYDRSHRAVAPPAAAELDLSADPAFRGAPERLNPEQLVLLAAASCQLLSFLAVAARARVDVVAYDDEGEAVLDLGVRPARLTAIVLRPRIVVAGGTDPDRVRHLVEVAHRECFIAASLRTPVRVEPVVAPADGAGGRADAP